MTNIRLSVTLFDFQGVISEDGINTPPRGSGFEEFVGGEYQRFIEERLTSGFAYLAPIHSKTMIEVCFASYFFEGINISINNTIIDNTSLDSQPREPIEISKLV